MKINDLVKGLDCDIDGETDLDILGLSYSSKDIKSNYIFFAIAGQSFDGHDFIEDAINNGASVIVHTLDVEKKHGIVYIRVGDIKKALSNIATNFYSNPQSKLKIIGITGTDGKSSSVYYIYQLMNLLGYKTGMFSTVSFDTGFGIQDNTLRWSTPESLDIIKSLSQALANGIEYFILESTSHALSSKTSRLIDIRFYCSGLTYIGHEHLDFHKTKEQYRDDKTNLFRQTDGFCILNLDSEFDYISKNCKNILTYSFSNKSADLHAVNVKSSLKNGLNFDISYNGKLYNANAFLIGDFNVDNLILVVGLIIKSTTKTIDEILPLLEKIKPTEGRMDILKAKVGTVLIDYAHSPDSYKKLLPMMRGYCKGRLTVVFGSGGQRDVEKRKIQGQLASKYCDTVIITEEDPRFEDNEIIMSQIESGVLQNPKVEYFKIANRIDAVNFAVRQLKNDEDLVMFLGKGHEKSIIRGDKKIPYLEKDTVLKALSNLN